MIFQHSLKTRLLSYPALVPFAEAYSHNAASVTEVIKGMPDEPIKASLQQAYSDALHSVWAALGVVAAVGLVVSLLTVEYTLDRPQIQEASRTQEE